MIHWKGNKCESIYLSYYTRSSETLLVLAYMPLTSPCATADPYLQTENICGGIPSILFDPFLWTPQSGTVLGAAEKTSLLALLIVFFIFGLQQKIFDLGFVFLYHHRTRKLLCCCCSSVSVEGIKQTHFICQPEKWKEREKNKPSITGC